MANFIISLLELNKRKVKYFKEIVFSDRKLFGNKWIFKNLGAIVIIIETILFLATAFVSLICFPFALMMAIIDDIYNFLKSTLYFRYFSKKYIEDSIKEHELRLNEKNLLCLKDIHNIHNWECLVLESNLDEFLSKFFRTYNNSYDTYDAVNKKLICRRFKRRSIGDIYLICKNYYPDTNLDDVIIGLIKLIKAETLAVSKCSDIKKYVFVRKDNYTGNYMTQDVEFIHGISFQQLMAYYERNRRLS